MKKGVVLAGVVLALSFAVCLVYAADAAAPVMFGGDTKAVDVKASTITVSGILATEGLDAVKRDMTFVVTENTKFVFRQRPEAKGLADIKIHDVSHVTYNPEEKKDGNPVAISIKVYNGPPEAK